MLCGGGIHVARAVVHGLHVRPRCGIDLRGAAFLIDGGEITGDEGRHRRVCTHLRYQQVLTQHIRAVFSQDFATLLCVDGRRESEPPTLEPQRVAMMLVCGELTCSAGMSMVLQSQKAHSYTLLPVKTVYIKSQLNKAFANELLKGCVHPSWEK